MRSIIKARLLFLGLVSLTGAVSADGAVTFQCPAANNIKWSSRPNPDGRILWETRLSASEMSGFEHPPLVYNVVTHSSEPPTVVFKSMKIEQDYNKHHNKYTRYIRCYYEAAFGVKKETKGVKVEYYANKFKTCTQKGLTAICEML